MIMGHEIDARPARARARAAWARRRRPAARSRSARRCSAWAAAGGYLADMGGQLLTLQASAATTRPRPTWSASSSPRAPATTRAPASRCGRRWPTASKSSQVELLSTHPSGPTRISDIEANLPKVQPLYERADKPDRTFGPPAASRVGAELSSRRAIRRGRGAATPGGPRSPRRRPSAASGTRATRPHGRAGPGRRATPAPGRSRSPDRACRGP